jgi:hypothetical protein
VLWSELAPLLEPLPLVPAVPPVPVVPPLLPLPEPPPLCANIATLNADIKMYVNKMRFTLVLLGNCWGRKALIDRYPIREDAESGAERWLP